MDLYCYVCIRWVVGWRFVRCPSWCVCWCVRGWIVFWGRLWRWIFLLRTPRGSFCFFWWGGVGTCIRWGWGSRCVLVWLLRFCRRWVGGATWWASWGGILRVGGCLRWVSQELLEDAVLVLQHLLHAGGRIEHWGHWRRHIAEIQERHLININSNQSIKSIPFAKG